jgi:hypothetical protein
MFLFLTIIQVNDGGKAANALMRISNKGLCAVENNVRVIMRRENVMQKCVCPVMQGPTTCSDCRCITLILFYFANLYYRGKGINPRNSRVELIRSALDVDEDICQNAAIQQERKKACVPFHFAFFAVH